MGMLRDPGGRAVPMPERLLVGRSPSAQIVVPLGDVSAEHALIAWGRDGWTVRDLGSRNGTWVGGRQLEPGERAPLTRGDTILLGLSRHPLLLESDAAPAALAISGAEVVEGDGTWLALPSGEQAEVVLVPDDEPGWVVLGDPSRRVRSGDEVEAGGRTWRVILPEGLHSTDVRASSEEATTVEFRVTLDEEHVQTRIRTGQATYELKPRAHHYVLLTLARARLEDEAAGVPSIRQGWRTIAQLERMLRQTRNHVCVQLYRARQELSRLGAAEAQCILESHPRTGAVRLHAPVLRIEAVG